jgi:hypothetical protein
MSNAGALAAQGNMAAAKKEMGQATKYLTPGSATLLAPATAGAFLLALLFAFCSPTIKLSC